MAEKLYYGIDLGTTNSAIARFRDGKVEILRNPVGNKETLPSVVAFRKGRVIVGDKAREYMERDPSNVVGVFKRKMGTSVRYSIQSTGEMTGPMELSAQVLRELKSFIYDGETPSAAVITIPASFDTVQSQATREAGLEAGFEYVELLQEPVAASLSYANKLGMEVPDNTQWLVYDLGGGTFDVALVRLKDGDMRVLDHEGDNYLGGADFDALIILKFIVPWLESIGKFENLEQEMRSASGRYNKLWFELMNKAEDAKIMLSAAEEADIEFEVEDDEGEFHDVFMTLKRSAFEEIIDPHIDRTVGQVKTILQRNEVAARDIAFVLLVGGSTYIPRVRERIAEALGIKANWEVDPTTAVAEGAAWFAGGRTIRQSAVKKEKGAATNSDIRVRTAFRKASQEDAEYFTAEVDGGEPGMSYRIIREDGGYDSGMVPFEGPIEEDLPLAPNVHNIFRLSIFDASGNPILVDIPPIGISHGKFSVSGQPLPEDICIEIDDVDENRTVLTAIFNKNDILPLRKTLVRTITRNVRKDSEDSILINVLEGSEKRRPTVNKPIGFISVKGSELERDLIRGSDVEITLEISESRELRISACLLMTDQEFTNVFRPNERAVNIPHLLGEIRLLRRMVEDRKDAAMLAQEFQLATTLTDLEYEAIELEEQCARLREDDVTDFRFQAEDRKREIALKLDELTEGDEFRNAMEWYYAEKKSCREAIDDFEATTFRSSFEELAAKEKGVLDSESPRRAEELAQNMAELERQVRWYHDPQRLINYYRYASTMRHHFSNPQRGEQLLKKGHEQIDKKEWDPLRGTINQLFELLPANERKKIETGTGIG